EGRTGELKRGRVGILRGPDIVPVQDVFPQRSVPAPGPQGRAVEAGRGRVRVGVEGPPAVPAVARPPADLDLLGVPRVAHDEVIRGGVDRPAGGPADG